MNNGIPPAADGNFTVPTAQPYDFRKPTRGLVEQSRSLDFLHADFAANFASELTVTLRLETTITPIAIELMRYDEFCAALSNPTCLSILRIDPPNAQACLDLPPNVVFPMINALGDGQISTRPVPHQALTQTELGHALQIVKRAAAQLADSFSRHAPAAVPIAVKEDEFCSDPAQVRLMPADEVITVMRFEVNIAGHHATMRLGLPAPVVDVLCDIAQPMTTGSSPPDRERDTQNLTQNIMQSAVELRALLADVKIRLSDVLDLQEGDVITTDISTACPIPLCLDHQTVHFGRLGQLHGNRAFQISDRRPDDTGNGNASSSGGKATL